MTKSEALKLFNNSPKQLADALEITRQAVHQWPDDQIPEKQELRLRYEILPKIGQDSAA